ncbi:NlpC/P60 family protein [Sphingobacterium olei]|uniref:NlpC/P60 family protein n=1 Tax=Sphingobacterium olei TaxID=2571155 RepID=A0A4U0NQK9_9SPHI|nr:C40 family peptidase [Sphingobacterium olei]TJZ52424.1 NlpC/P60 family protein [Sphingobacterium olei]
MENFKTALILIFLISLGVTSEAQAQVDSTQYHRIVQIIDENSRVIAPDKRTKILEIAAENISDNQYIIQTTEKDAVIFLQQKLSAVPAKVTFKTLPDSSVGDQVHGIINLSVANLRTQPSHAAEMATQVLLGTQVDILQKNGGDFRIRTPEGYIAWVPTSSVTAMTKTELSIWKKKPKLIYIEEFGRSYSAANSSSQRISDLVYGNILSLLLEESEYYKVEYPDKRIAYILKDEAVLFEKWVDSRQATPENVILSAKSMLGLPYLWGGTSVKGVDCSGFTKTSFYMNGFVIPRDASQQVLAGEKIEILDEEGNFSPALALKNLNPADLLFFAAGKNKNPNARITHVALYLGNGEFIHAAGTVRINSMLKDSKNYDDFQSRTVVAARRYIGTKDEQIKVIKDHSYYTN